MPCYYPLDARRGPVQKSGKRSIVFRRKDAEPSLDIFELKLPCGQCIGCKLERSRQWAMRCMHEASLYERNCFVTLTYDGARLPEGGSLSVKTFQGFMRKLRRWINRDQYDRLGNLIPVEYRPATQKVRFFHCGEYGEKYGRPHYHALLFNFDFSDKQVHKVQNGQTLYSSDSLSRIWGNGFALIGDVTFESAAYVARYCLKKLTGPALQEENGEGLLPYEKLDVSSGEITKVKPEYVTMSRRPGIGKPWFDKFKLDVYPHDFAILRGMKVRPPKFYDSQYEISDPDEFKALKVKRMSRATVLVPTFNQALGKTQLLDDNRAERLVVKEEVLKSKLTALKRPLEE